MGNYLIILFLLTNVIFSNTFGKDVSSERTAIINGLEVDCIFINPNNTENTGTFLYNKTISKSNHHIFIGNDERKSTDSITTNRYFTNYLLIPYNAGLEIIRLDKEGLTRNLLAMSVFAATLSADQAIRNLFQDKLYAGDNTTSRFLFNVGNRKYFLPGFVGAYGISIITGDRYFEKTMLLSAQSLVITLGFSELAKNTVLRVRPRHSPDNPFTREKGNQSFISGHAAGMWSVMTVFAGRYPNMRYGAYLLATAVSIARVYDDAHWTSDIFVGSVLGYGIGRLTLNVSNSHGNNLTILPYMDNTMKGAVISLKF